MVLSIKFGKSMTFQTCAFEKSSSGQWPSLQLQLERQRKAALLAFKCVNGLTPFIFKEYFKRVSHGRGTRGDSVSLKLPSIKFEVFRKAFSSKGAGFSTNYRMN